MRPSLTRVGVIAAIGLLAVAATGANAAATPFKAVAITDTAGDANGLNGQGFTDVPSSATPANYSGGDIVGISWVTNGTKAKPNGFTVTMTLSAVPGPSTIFRVTTATADCTTFWLNYSATVDGKITQSLQHNCPGFTPAGATGTSESVTLANVVVKEKTITWTVPASALPKAVKAGTELTELSGHTRFYAGSAATGGATVPLVDEAAGAGSYVYGK